MLELLDRGALCWCVACMPVCGCRTSVRCIGGMPHWVCLVVLTLRWGWVCTRARWGKDAGQGNFCVFNLQHAIVVLRLLVENSYVRFAGHVFHQTCGVPMGINPTSFIANYYLFQYEYILVKQLVTDAIQSGAATQRSDWYGCFHPSAGCTSG
eukprot:GHUV01030431.1.p2 GENE.GHUV01030431.1~~GHUV01030431.1.p2  ORF type:complete len:153 (+),score=5.82 GHUV01030431.1:123-581(+)